VNLDISGKYFAMDSEFMTVSLPKSCTPNEVNEVSNYLKTKTSEAVDAGVANVIFDTQKVESLNTEVVKLLLQSMQLCRDLSLNYALAGNEKVVTESKKFEESKDWNFCDSIDAAKGSF
ncbi:MAG: response regulator, partial [Opitutales bacterium TMED158]